MKSVTVQAEDKNHFPPARKVAVHGVNVTIGHQIARGAYSTVHDTTDEWGHKLVTKVYHSNVKPEIWRHEVMMLRKFASPWVTPLHHGFEHQGQGYLVMSNVGLALGRCQYEGSNEQIARHVARGLLAGLHHIHRAGYAHTDINPQNVMIEIPANNQMGPVRLVDFAFVSKVADLAVSKRPMALWIPPPEYLDTSHGQRGHASDIYHAALVIKQVATNTKLQYEPDDCLNNLPSLNAQKSDSPLVRALSQALSIRPENRPTAIEMWRMIMHATQRVK